MFRYHSDLTTVTWGSGSDFSAVTTIAEHCQNAPVTTYTFPTNADFSAVASGTNFLNNSGTSNGMGQTGYENFLVRMDATNSATPGTLNMGGLSVYGTGSAAETARTALLTAGWSITDGGAV